MLARGSILALLITTVATPALARPYEDTQGRFSIEVPEGWAFEPGFGDTQGLSFKREIEGGRPPVVLSVHIDAIESADFKSFAQAIEAEVQKRGYARLDKKLADVGGRHAVLMEYGPSDKAGGDPLARIRAYFLEVAGHRYHLLVEGQQNSLRRFDKDLLQILKSFQAKAGAGSEAMERALAKQRKPVDATQMVGKWINEDGLVMVLHADGGFALGEAKGRYEITGRTLIFILPGQGRESFTFSLDDAGAVLTVTSDNLEKPMAYRRVGAAAEPEGEPEAPEPGGAAPTGGPSKQAGLTGRWSSPLKTGALILELSSAGTFSMGKSKGRWVADFDQLTLTSARGEAVRYHFDVVGDTLRLSGGDLEELRIFRKLGGR